MAFNIFMSVIMWLFAFGCAVLSVLLVAWFPEDVGALICAGLMFLLGVGCGVLGTIILIE